MFQNPRAALNPMLRIGRQLGDVIAFIDSCGETRWREATIGALAEVRIPDSAARLKAYPAEPSGGMCQRVMLAIALAGNPALLVADEPTTGLDTTTQAAVLELIAGNARSRNMATLLITHDLALARAHADRIVVMHAGQIVEAAPVAGLFERPRHPYTKCLLGATPGAAATVMDLAGIAGGPPTLRDTVRPAVCPNAADRALAIFCAGSSGARGDRARAPQCMLESRMNALPGNHRPSQAVPDRARGRTLHAIDGVTLTVGAGRSLGLVGESGSGKSTLGTAAVRLIDPTAGTIHYDGQDIGAIPAQAFGQQAIRPQIQFVFQGADITLNPTLTIARNIAIGMGPQQPRATPRRN